MRRCVRALLGCSVLSFATGCGSPSSAGTSSTTPGSALVDGSAGTGHPSVSDRYLPLSVGATWTYHSVDAASGVALTAVTRVEALEDVGGPKAGIMAYRVRAQTPIGFTVSWIQDLGTSLVTQREQFLDPSNVLNTEYYFMPNRLRLDESDLHTTAGATWTEMNTATVHSLNNGTTKTGSFTAQWTVEAVDEMVTVPAGTFPCMRLHRVETGFASMDEVQWLARRVGKVKQTGADNEDLIAYSLP